MLRIQNLLLAVALVATFVNLESVQAVPQFGYERTIVSQPQPRPLAGSYEEAEPDQETLATAESMQVYYDDLVRLHNIMENDMIPTQAHLHQDDDY